MTRPTPTRSSSRARLFGRALLCAAAPLAAAPLAAAQGFDLVPVTPMTVTQAIQTGTTPLIAGRSTFVRVGLNATGTVPPGTMIDGILRVYSGATEVAWSPIYSDNGPIPKPPASGDPTQENHTLNFVFVPPQAGTYVLRAEINPAGPSHVEETNTANNITGALVEFHCRSVVEIVYVPIDYRPSGGPVPNLPDLAMIEPGSGDNFLQAVYAAPDFDYHRSDAPSKLWTSSLSGSGSSLNSSLIVDMQLMVPKPDFIYGWVPGGLPYNGMASGIPGSAAMGNTEPWKFQRTFAHEVGHLHGLVHIGGTTGIVGVDVERHLKITENLPTIKPANLSDIMVAGLNTNQAWVNTGTWMTVFNHPAYQCDAGGAADVAEAPVERRLLVAGLLDHHTGAVDVTDTLVFAGGVPTPSVDAATANLVVRAHAGHAVHEVFVLARSSADSCAGCRAPRDGETADSDDHVAHDSPFVVVLPAALDGVAIERVEVLAAPTEEPLAVVHRSANAPTVQFAAAPPFLGAQLVEWTAADADGDALRYYLRYSPNGERFVPLATNVTGTSWRVDFDALPTPVSGRAFLEVLATDGLHTSTAQVHALADAGDLTDTNRPWTQILSPDHGTTWREGATIVLHASGWDLEDRSLSGTSIRWTSDVDGFLAFGRVASVARLSVGTHKIRVSATDAAGLVGFDEHTITVTARPTPGSVVHCQANLGSGGPGNAVLALCGGDLSSGTTADLTLTGAAPSAPAWLAIGATQTPVPFGGGTFLVGIPDALLFIGNVNASGGLGISGLPGGGGPATFYLQGFLLDAAQPQGVALTNALELTFLP